MVGAAVSWAFATITTKLALRDLAPLDLLAVELVTGAAVVWVAVVVRGRPFAPARPRPFVLLGAFEPALSFALFDYGLDRTGAADGALLVASEGLFAVVFAAVLLGERVPPRTAAALAFGIAGTALVALGQAGQGASVAGDLLVLGGSASAAAYSVGARRFTRDDDTLTATAVQLLAGVVLVSPLLVFGAASGASTLGSAGADPILIGVATGVLGSALPFLLFNVAIRDITVAGSAVISNLIPVMAAALAVGLLGERLGPAQLAGGALVVLAAFGAGQLAPEPVAEAR
jgi:DME family drug/metabolite transporter